MENEKQIVTIEMATSDRLRLNEQIGSQMEKLGIGRYHWDKLHLGFDLPPGWPADINAQPTMAQLMVIAKKLGMKIIINDLNMISIKQSPEASKDAVTGESGL